MFGNFSGVDGHKIVVTMNVKWSFDADVDGAGLIFIVGIRVRIEPAKGVWWCDRLDAVQGVVDGIMVMTVAVGGHFEWFV